MKNVNLFIIATAVTTVFLVYFCSFSMNAQDLVVTTKRDTLNCKLGKLKNDFYPVEFVIEDSIYSGLIHKDSVYFLKKDVFLGLQDNRLRPWYPLVEIGVDAGVAHQFGKFRMDDDLTGKSAFGAKTGWFFGTELTYYISKRVGYGIKYNYRSLLDGDICYQYFGAMMVFRFLERKKTNHFFFNYSAGLGWMVQKNAPVQLYLLRPRIEMHARSLSGDIAVGYDFRLAKIVSARIKVSCNIGYPSFTKIMGLEKMLKPSDHPIVLGDYCKNMNTINVTAGFSFHK